MFVCFIGLCSADTVDFRIFLFFRKVLGFCTNSNEKLSMS